MKTLFADTYYFIALLSPSDEQHALAREYTSGFQGAFVTTPWVLAEVGNALAIPPNRALFVDLVNDLRADRRVVIVPAADELFERGYRFYGRRPDKEWGLTDCISFVVMQERGLTEALTADHHFEQAGFAILLK